MSREQMLVYCQMMIALIERMYTVIDESNDAWHFFVGRQSGYIVAQNLLNPQRADPATPLREYLENPDDTPIRRGEVTAINEILELLAVCEGQGASA